MSVSRVAEFFSGKKVFLTGGSGFVGKCLAWKLLSSCPGIDKVYLLLRGRSEQEFYEKFQNIIHSQVFESIRKENPKLLSKLEGVRGDITLPLCGLNPGQLKKIEDVQIFFHSAAAINLYMKLPRIMHINVGGTRNVLELANQVNHVKAFVHISTAYNMCPGVVDEKVYPTNIEPEDALDFFAKLPADWNAPITKIILKDKISTYAYSKHMGEKVVERAWNNLPVTIVRPGAISSAMTEPLPGWNETTSSSSKWLRRLFDGSYHTVLANSQGRFELTPVDYTANTCLAAAWRLGNSIPKKFHVYNCVPNRLTNPVMLRDWIKWGCEPLSAEKRKKYYPTISKNPTLFEINNYLFRKIPGQFRSLMKHGSDQNFQKDYNEAQILARTFKIAIINNWEFVTANMTELNQLMDPLDRQLFPIDFDQIDWKLFTPYLVQGLYSYEKHLNTSDFSSPNYKKNIVEFPTL